MLRLRPRGAGLTVVGDDAQAIYSFRAATVRNILDFPRSFDPPARIVTLDRNYRSTAPILAAANAVIALAPERFAKELWTERTHGAPPALVTVADEADQARFVARRCSPIARAGATLKSQAVLFRASHHCAALELELTRRNIPFVKFGGLKFLDAAHVKDALALMRFAENPRDRVAGFRVAQLLPGVGPKIAEKIVAAAAGGRRLCDDGALALPAKARAGFSAFADLCAASRRAPRPGRRRLGDAVAWLSPPHRDALRRRAPFASTISRRLSGSPRPCPRASVSSASSRSIRPTRRATKPVRRCGTRIISILSTIHSAKGQEWRSVFVLNCVDGCIPSDLATGTTEEIEEERRLLYVAMTRAKDELALIMPQRFYVHGQPKKGDRSVYASRTRFIRRRC